MANIKSAKKRVVTHERNRQRNRVRKSEIKTYIRQFDAALEANDTNKAGEILKTIDKKLKRASLKSAVSKNSAARTVSRLQKRLNAVA